MTPRKYSNGKRQAASEAIRQRILEATLALHAKHGIFGTSWKDIAKEADVSLATVHNYFPYEDEAFWVLEGSVTFEVGDKTVKAEAGSFLLGHNDIPHRYYVDTGPAWLLFILSPAGFEDLVRVTSDPAPTPVLPPPMDEPPDQAEMEQLATIIQQYGREILG